MNEDIINQLEKAQITLNTAKGLADTINYLAENQAPLFTEYPSNNKGKQFQAKQLWSQLLALSHACVNSISQIQLAMNNTVNNLYKSGDKPCN